MFYILWRIFFVDMMKGLIIGKEWGVGYIGKGYCYVVLIIMDKMKIEDVKKILCEDYKIVLYDIQFVKNLEWEKVFDIWDGYEYCKWQKQVEIFILCLKRLLNCMDI